MKKINFTRKLHVRWMIRRDMAEVLAIESEVFQPCHWDENEFIRRLRKRNCIGLIVEDRDTRELLGYTVYDLYKNRIEIENLAVKESARHEGVARAIITKMKAKLSTQRRRKLRALIREDNLDALLAFKALGFQAKQIERRPYENDDRDGYWMEIAAEPTWQGVNRIAEYFAQEAA